MNTNDTGRESDEQKFGFGKRLHQPGGMEMGRGTGYWLFAMLVVFYIYHGVCMLTPAYPASYVPFFNFLMIGMILGWIAYQETGARQGKALPRWRKVLFGVLFAAVLLVAVIGIVTHIFSR